MNQRINQLLCQAYDEAVPETWTTLSSEQLGRIYDKFALLLFGNVESIWNQRLKDCMLYPHKNLIQTFNQTLKFVPKSVRIIFKD